MAGRKRKTAPRNRDGRLKNQPRTGKALAENMRDAMRPTLDFRCRVMGWPQSRWLDARDPRLATLHGRLSMSHVSGSKHTRLSEREYLGLSSYAVRRHRWLRAIEAPPESAKCSTLETEPPQAHETPQELLSKGPLPEDWEAYVRRVTADFMAAEQVLLSTGYKATVMDVLTADEDVAPDRVPPETLIALKRAAKKLARHFGHN